MRKTKKIGMYAMIAMIGFLSCLAITSDKLIAGWSLLNGLERMEAGDTHGFYSIKYGYMVCDNESSCFHEIGHWKDKSLDWISQTPEFQEAVDNFILECIENKNTLYIQTNYCRTFTNFPGLNGNPLLKGYWGGYKEVYAGMYGNNLYHQRTIPDIFTDFYK